MSAIYKRELRSYFSTVIGYIFVAVTLFFSAVFFWGYNLSGGYPLYSYAVSGGSVLIFSLLVPILTMKSFAEERKSKTDQMLLTYPVSVSSIVLGKFFSMMTVVAIPVFTSFLFSIYIALFGGGAGSLLIDFSTILAFFFMCGVYVSIGMFISSMTENQVIAAVLSIAALLLLYFWDSLVGNIATTAVVSVLGLAVVLIVVCIVIYLITRSMLTSFIVGGVGIITLITLYAVKSSLFDGLLSTILVSLSLVTPLANFAYNNLFDMSGIFLYVSLAALFIFLTAQSVQKRRWS